MTKIVYRADHRSIADGEEMVSAGDHYDGLTGDQKKAEDEIRAAPNGGVVRSGSLYVYEHPELAATNWQHSKGRHLYELEIDEADIVHSGNLDTYTEVVAAIRSGRDPSPLVGKYWSKEVIGQRTEHLVRKAKVVRQLKNASDWLSPIKRVEQRFREDADNEEFYNSFFGNKK